MKVEFTSGSLTDNTYRALREAGVSDAQIDRGYHTIDYARPGPNEVHQGKADGRLDPREVFETALDLFDRDPEDPQYRKIVQDLAGRPIPWVLDDFNPLTGFDESVRTRVREAITVLAGLLAHEGLTPGTPAYQEGLALGLYHFTACPQQKRLLRDKREVFLSMTEPLRAAGLAGFQRWLFEHGGLGTATMVDDEEVELPALSALQKGRGSCTERSIILYGVFKLAGLQPFFCYSPTASIQPKLMATGVPVDTAGKYYGHVYIGIHLEDGQRFYDLQDLQGFPTTLPPADYPNKFPWRLIHLLAGLEGNRGITEDDFVAAGEPIRRAITLEPTNDNYYYMLGSLLRRHGDHVGAEAALRRAIALNPGRQVYLEEMNLILQAQGKMVDAATLLVAEAAEAPPLTLPNDAPRGRDWSKLSPFAADLDRFLGENQVPHAVRNEIVDGALLKTPEYLPPSEQPIFHFMTTPAWREMLGNFFRSPQPDSLEPAQRLRIDPLGFDSVDPYGYLVASSREEFGFLIENYYRMNPALNYLIIAYLTSADEKRTAKGENEWRRSYLLGLIDLHRIRALLAGEGDPVLQAACNEFCDGLIERTRARKHITLDFQERTLTHLSDFLAENLPELTVVTEPGEIQREVKALAQTLKGRWAAVYYDGYLMPEPAAPLSDDGDLPAPLRYHLEPLFDTREEQELLDALVPYPAGPAADLPSLRRLRHVIDNGLPEFLGREGAEHTLEIWNQMSHHRFEPPAPPPLGDFSYSDLIIPPTRENVMNLSNTLLTDLDLATARLDEETGVILFYDAPVWERLQNALVDVAEDIVSDKKDYAGRSLYVVDDFPARTLWGQGERIEVTTEVLAARLAEDFSLLAGDFLRGLREQVPLPELGTYLAEKHQALAEVLAHLSDQRERTAYSRQYGKLFDAIIDVLDTPYYPPAGGTPTELVKHVATEYLLPVPTGANEFAAYFDQYLWLLRNFRDSLFNQATPSSEPRFSVPNNVYSENTLAAAKRVSAVLERADKILSLPEDPLAALAAWPAFQGFMVAVNGADTDGCLAPSLFSFLFGQTDARDFYQTVSGLPAPSWLVSDDMLKQADYLEAEVLGFLRPAQALKFINRLRYALYLAKFRVERERVLAERQAVTVASPLTPAGVSAAWGTLQRFTPLEGLPPQDPEAILQPLRDVLGNPHLYQDHREYFDQEMQNLPPEEATALEEGLADWQAFRSTATAAAETEIRAMATATNAQLLRALHIFNHDLLTIAQNGLPDPLQVRIRADLEHWVGALDTGWPTPNGSSLALADPNLPEDQLFRPDTDFSPTGALYLDYADFLNLLVTADPDQREEDRIRQLTLFLTDYNNGYYRYFSPIAFERDTAGREIKGVRDHTAYNRLLIVLQDIAEYAEYLLASDPSADAGRRAGYERSRWVARAVAYDLEICLAAQPALPFWTITRNDRITGTVPQDLITLPPVIPAGVPEEMNRLSAQNTIAQVQTYPGDFHRPDGFFTRLTDGFGFTDWLTRTRVQFVAADFDALTPEDWMGLRERLRTEFPGVAETTTRYINRLAQAADEIVYDDTYDPGKNYVIEQKMKMAGILNEMIAERQLYADNRTFFDARIAALSPGEQAEIRHLLVDTAAIRDPDYPGLTPDQQASLAHFNFLLISLIDPKLVPTTYEIFLRPESPNALLITFEETLRPLPEPQELEFIDWYLSTAGAPEICYLLGRLLEISEVTITERERLKRYEEIREKVLHLALRQLKAIPKILRQPATRGNSFLTTAGDPSYATQFLRDLSPAELLWVGPYIRQKVAASERERKNRTDDVHYENVRQTDIDRYLFGLDRQTALALKERVLTAYAPGEDAAVLDDDTAARLADAIETYFRRPQATQGRKTALQAFNILDRRHNPDPLTMAQMLAAAAGLAAILNGERAAEGAREADDGGRPQVERFLALARSADLTEWQRMALYEFAYNTAVADYKAAAQTFLRETAVKNPGLLDGSAGDGRDLVLVGTERFSRADESWGHDSFWAWLVELIVRGEERETLDGADPKSLVAEMDAMISQDLGDDIAGGWVSHLDLPTEGVLRHTLSLIRPAAPDQIQMVEEALFASFNLADPAERARHSRYNPNGYFQEGPKMDLARIFSPENLVRIHIHHDREVMARLIYSKPHAIADTLFGVRTLLEMPEEDADWEALARRSFRDEDVLAALLLDAVVWGQLKRDTMALLSHRTHPYPSLRPEQAAERFAWIERRVSGRVREIKAERRLRELVALWAVGPSDKIQSVADVPWREAADLDDAATARSAALCAELGALYRELATAVPTAAGEAHAAYLREQCEEIRLAVLLATQFAVDPADPAMPATYEELAQQLWSELTDLAGTSPPLKFFGEALREEIFEPATGVMTQPFIHISGKDVGEDIAGKFKNIYWMSSRYLTLALVTLAGIQRRVAALRGAGVPLTAHQIGELERLQNLLVLRRRYLEQQLKKERELAHL